MTAEPVFLVSTGRTGTKTLARVFSEAFPQIEAHHESFPFSRLINILGNIHVAGLLRSSTIGELWKTLKLWQIRRSKSTFYVDSNHYYAPFVGAIANILPEARFVHIVRDPRDVVASFMNWSRHRARSWIASTLVPFWRPNGYLAGEFRFAEWSAMGRFEKHCWNWRFTNDRIADQLSGSSRYLCVRFEDLFRGPGAEEAFLGLCRFIGVDESARPASELLETHTNAPKARSFPSWRSWTNGQCAALDAICGRLMATHGYGEETEWTRMVRGAKTAD